MSSLSHSEKRNTDREHEASGKCLAKGEGQQAPKCHALTCAGLSASPPHGLSSEAALDTCGNQPYYVTQAGVRILVTTNTQDCEPLLYM